MSLLSASSSSSSSSILLLFFFSFVFSFCPLSSFMSSTSKSDETEGMEEDGPEFSFPLSAFLSFLFGCLLRLCFRLGCHSGARREVYEPPAATRTAGAPADSTRVFGPSLLDFPRRRTLLSSPFLFFVEKRKSTAHPSPRLLSLFFFYSPLSFHVWVSDSSSPGYWRSYSEGLATERTGYPGCLVAGQSSLSCFVLDQEV